MAEVLAVSLAFPTVIFTGLLALALLYWLFVVLGALDLDLLGGGHAVPDVDGVAKGVLEGATKGVLEGATKGVLEGATKGVLEGATKGVLEGATKGVLEGATKGVLEGAAEGVSGPEGAAVGSALGPSTEPTARRPRWLSSLRLDRAPATVSLTLITAFGWLVSVLATISAEPRWIAAGLPSWLLGLPIFATALGLALPLTSLAIRPLGPLFVTKSAPTRGDLVGRVCVISTGRVDANFGQATLEDGGAGLILDVRCDTPGLLRNGDRALILSADAEHQVFQVEALDDLLAAPGRSRPNASCTASAKATGDDDEGNGGADGTTLAHTASRRP